MCSLTVTKTSLIALSTNQSSVPTELIFPPTPTYIKYLALAPLITTFLCIKFCKFLGILELPVVADQLIVKNQALCY